MHMLHAIDRKLMDTTTPTIRNDTYVTFLTIVVTHISPQSFKFNKSNIRIPSQTFNGACVFTYIYLQTYPLFWYVTRLRPFNMEKQMGNEAAEPAAQHNETKRRRMSYVWKLRLVPSQPWSMDVVWSLGAIRGPAATVAWSRWCFRKGWMD